MKVIYSLLILITFNLLLVKGKSLSSSSSRSDSNSNSNSESSTSEYSSSSSTSSSSSIEQYRGFECINAGGICNEFNKYCRLGYGCFNLKLNNETEEYEGICKESLKFGEICESNSCELGLVCSHIVESKDEEYIKGEPYRCIDVEFASLGEECETSTQCLGTLECIDSKCSTNSTTCEENHNCKSQYYCSGGECDFGLVCPIEYMQCLPVKSIGGSCIYGHECDYHTTCVNGTCIKKNSLKNGEDCDDNSDACESLQFTRVYNSDRDEYDSICASPDTLDLDSCIENGCPDHSYYFCDAKSNKCVPFLSTSQECKQAQIERDLCYINNNCILLNGEPTSDAHYNNKSCYMKNCKKETINFLYQCDMHYKICN